MCQGVGHQARDAPGGDLRPESLIDPVDGLSRLRSLAMIVGSRIATGERSRVTRQSDSGAAQIRLA
jgi:hypothetical protein